MDIARPNLCINTLTIFVSKETCGMRHLEQSECTVLRLNTYPLGKPADSDGQPLGTLGIDAQSLVLKDRKLFTLR